MTSKPFSVEPVRRVAWAVLALVLAATLGLSAQAARRGWSPLLVAAIPPKPMPMSIPTLAPRSAAPPAAPADDLAAPAAGTTGTTALPAVPLPALADAGDRGVTAARPFGFGRTPRLDRVRALECLTSAIYYEAATEPDAGQQAVAQVVLNRVRHPAFPSTVCGVVYQGSEKAGCQFSFACDGSILRHRPSAAGWARAALAAAAALGGHIYAPVGLATHYHSFAVTPAWNRSLVMTDVVGAHFFHRWKGWWGTAAAFRQLYAGGEPLPEPHAPLVVPPPMTTPIVALVAAVPAPPTTTTPASIQPAWRGSGTIVASAPAAADHLPPASTILPEWRDSGRSLR